jgi:ribonuclease P protein subunit POP4
MRTSFIGKHIRIIESTNKSLFGIEGRVVDETKNIISIETDGNVRKIAKDQCVFEIDEKQVEGRKITKKPEERIK